MTSKRHEMWRSLLNIAKALAKYKLSYVYCEIGRYTRGNRFVSTFVTVILRQCVFLTLSKPSIVNDVPGIHDSFFYVIS